ncbi:glucosaminidase domain-containing protein [Caldibacillus thermoamylovorans]|uniref:PA14 domain-containing protein n=1 Tax=Caldibacillus thermoamylovorans TaxID=35841 RepID=UPI001D060A15|nr:PA14 domain-containing protein [Caldibacillus thermoamylovorans]MCB5935972.1 glucosaminidase domain-containing protein [Bacillus sp. DFI.2.34]MCB7077981.1 glucosaminidase domain-containing protein [Caldibacillus thermoamylovorans]
MLFAFSPIINAESGNGPENNGITEWKAEYYANQNLSGRPGITQEIVQNGSFLIQDYGLSNPITGIPADHFSVRFSTQMKIKAGDYVLSLKGDDGARVYIDGQLVLDMWKNGAYHGGTKKIEISDRNTNNGKSDIHSVEVHYYDIDGAGNLEFEITRLNEWVGFAYSNQTFSGTPVTINSGFDPLGNSLSFNWGNGSPSSDIPNDFFSVRFSKKVNLETGTYVFNATADDAVRVWVDNQLVLDFWNGNYGKINKKSIHLSKGIHNIVVEYKEIDQGAYLNVDYEKVSSNKVFYNYGGEVAYNWGMNSPGPGFTPDHFETLFEQKKWLDGGDHFIQTTADNGIKVTFDGDEKISRWTDEYETIERALLLNVTKGNHTIKTRHYDDVYGAAVFSNVVPFGTWLAYYYPNQELTGSPIASKTIGNSVNKLVENIGNNSPAIGVSPDHFSARYSTAQRLSAGEYQLSLKGDDGARVYIDGQLVLDLWKNGAYHGGTKKITISDRNTDNSNEKDIHWIEVQYYDIDGASNINFEIAKLNEWVGYAYSNETFSGSPVLISEGFDLKGNSLSFNWGNGSPVRSIPNDHFSVRFNKKVNLETGTYVFNATADDAVRVWVDNQLVLDFWNGNYGKVSKKSIYLTKGIHDIVVEYKEIDQGAYLNFNYEKVSSNKVLYKYGGEVAYNWGMNSPGIGFSSDHFETLFEQDKWLTAGDYFIQTTADNGVKVKVNGEEKINRWTDEYETIERALLLNVKEGNYSIRTSHYDDVYGAAVFSNVVPFGTWLAYYYPNENLSGSPVASKAISNFENKLIENSGTGSPASGVSPDHFSARYTTAKRIKAGEYVVRIKGDDNARVYIDDQLVLDMSKNGAYHGEAKQIAIKNSNTGGSNTDIHWIEVQYAEIDGASNIEFEILPIDKVINTNEWVGYIYPNENLSGSPIILGGVGAYNPIPNSLSFNWGYSSPSKSGYIPNDHFSARFTKKVNLETGTYVFNTTADDAVRVWVDNQLVLDFWNGNYGRVDKKSLYLLEGIHNIIVEYKEIDQGAYLNFDYKKVSSNNVFYKYGGEVAYNWGMNSPGPGFPADHFETLFEQEKWYSRGDYFIQATADNGVKVEVDGEVKINRWTGQWDNIDRALWLNVPEGNHTVRTSHYDDEYGAALFSNVIPFGTWLAYYYPNTTLSGSPTASYVIKSGSNNLALNENYGYGSPVEGMASDNFTVRYSTAKRIDPGNYMIVTNVDDGVRIYIDGKIVVDNWIQNSSYQSNSYFVTINNQNIANSTEANIHWIDIEYREANATSHIDFELKPVVSGTKIITGIETPLYRSFEELSDYTKHLTFYNPSYTRYGMLQYGDIVYIMEQYKYATKVRTEDGKIGWVHSSYLDESTTKDLWLVKDARTFRTGPGTQYSNIGTIQKDERVYVLNYTKTTGAYSDWYEILTTDGRRGWIWGALVSDLQNSGYNLVKYEFEKAGNITNDITSNTPLLSKSSVTAEQLNQFIAYKTGVKSSLMAGMGAAYIRAQEESGLNAIYLLAHSAVETGWGTSGIVKNKYNYYGIGAIDSQPAQGAFTFDSKEGGIIAGALWIKNNYVARELYASNYAYSQPTIENMRFDDSWHQYSTDEAWVSKIVYIAQELKNYLGL